MKTKKGIIEVLAMIKSGEMTPIKDDYGNVISINVTANPNLKIKDVQYVKNVYGNIVMGSTKEELESDEKALREFIETWSETNVLRLINIASILNKPELDQADIAYLNSVLARYVEDNKEVKVVEKTIKVTEPAKKGKYPNLYQDLYSLDVKTLKEMKRQATKNGADDLKNACRTVLRHKGVNC